jgi:hypothetical protein
MQHVIQVSRIGSLQVTAKQGQGPYKEEPDPDKAWQLLNTRQRPTQTPGGWVG